MTVRPTLRPTYPIESLVLRVSSKSRAVSSITPLYCDHLSGHLGSRPAAKRPTRVQYRNSTLITSSSGASTRTSTSIFDRLVLVAFLGQTINPSRSAVAKGYRLLAIQATMEDRGVRFVQRLTRALVVPSAVQKWRSKPLVFSVRILVIYGRV